MQNKKKSFDLLKGKVMVKKFKQYSDNDGKPWRGKWVQVKPEELDDIPSSGKNEQHWGYHLLVDASDCNHDIDDPKIVELFIRELVKKLKMKPIGQPMVVKVNGEDGRGTTAVQIITTSTITFHGDDEKWSVYLDVFSCKEYEPKVALDLFNRYFKPKHIAYKWILRDAGNYPK